MSEKPQFRVTVDKRGRITITESVRRAMNLSAGDEVDVYDIRKVGD